MALFSSPAAMPMHESADDDLQPMSVHLRLRRALALPIYSIALILSYASDLLGSLAARIAGD
jgi:hypothetical protein